MRDTNKLTELAEALLMGVNSQFISSEYAKSVFSKYLIDEGFMEKRSIVKIEPKPEVK